MRTRILLFCGIVLTVCLWLLLHQAPKPPKIESPGVQVSLTNQPTPTQAVEQSQPLTNIPQSIPKTGTDLYSQMRSNLLSPERRMRLEQFQEAWRTPIEFYGLAVDENTNPVADAQVNFDCNDLSPTGTSYYHTQSDANGFFSIKGIKGKLLGVKVSKEGYYSYHPNGDFFYYAGENENFVPDQNNPVIFHLRKKGQTELLIHTAKNSLLDADGKPTEVSLRDGHLASTGQGDLRVEFKAGKPIDGFPWRITWECQVTIPGGGLIQTSDEFPFLAPENGYQEFDRWSVTSTNWTESMDRQYYVKLRDGNFGRVNLRVRGISGRADFRMGSFLNPSASRNLEPK